MPPTQEQLRERWRKQSERRRQRPDWVARKRPYFLAYKLRTRFGLTFEQVEALLMKQGHTCAICRAEGVKLVVDHDHATGRVRGMLCSPCNTALNRAETDIGWLDAARRYLTS
jgi:hypothetical protein